MESQTGVGGHNTHKNKKKKTRGGQPKDFTSQYYYGLGLGVAAVSAGLFIHGFVNTPGDTATEIICGGIEAGIEAVRMDAASLTKHAVKSACFHGLADAFKRTLDHTRGVKDDWNTVGAIGAAAVAVVKNCHKGLRASLSSGLCHGAAAAVLLSLFS